MNKEKLLSDQRHNLKSLADIYRMGYHTFLRNVKPIHSQLYPEGMRNRVLTPRQVKFIVEHLGLP